MAASVAMSVTDVDALRASEWDDIWNLTRRYVDTSREYLESKLRKHTQIATFRAGSELVGMAALDVYATTFERKRRVIIFTSSVVIDEPYRGRALIQRLGIRSYCGARLQNPVAPIYWMFDTFSYKSYLLLARNFTEFWPRRDATTPPAVASFIDHLAQERYGEDWVRDRGIVRSSGHKKLRPMTAPVSDAMLTESNLRFFVGANPGHADGDMLVCLCPLTMRNWAKALAASARFFLRRL